MKTAKTDTELWEAYKKGDRAAFSDLFKRFYPILLSYGAKLTAEQHILEDCIQELFLDLWKSKNQSIALSVKAYLFTSLKYKLFRHLGQQKSFVVQEPGELAIFELSHDNFLAQREEDAAKAQALIHAFDQLPARQKEIIYLKYYMGLSYEEISAVMQINYQVARNLLYLSIKALKKIVSVTKFLIFLLSFIH